MIRGFRDSRSRWGRVGLALCLLIPGRVAGGLAEDAPAITTASLPAEQWARSEVERGELLIGELRCTACHVAPEPIAGQLDCTDPPDLVTRLARRPPGFLARYLDSPRSLHPDGTMPDLLVSMPEPEKARVIRELTAFLASRVAVVTELPKPVHPIRYQQGRVLFHRVGCVACHPPFEPADAVFELPGGEAGEAEDEALARPLGSRVLVELVELRAQWTTASLTDFLLDPRGSEARRRMPPMNLTVEEAGAIAGYLLGRERREPSESGDGSDAAMRMSPEGGPETEQAAAGRSRFEELGCAACHQLEVEGRALTSGLVAPPLTDLVAGTGPGSCLSALPPAFEDADAPAGLPVPRYSLDPGQAHAIRAALRALADGLPEVTVADRVHLTLARFNCLACHERGGQGGPDGKQAAYFRSLAPLDLGWEGWLPPHLNGVGAKLRREWLSQVLGEGTRVRPYLATHMPTLDRTVVPALAGDLRTADRREDWESEVPPREAAAAKGRDLLGGDGLACVTCHRFEGNPGLLMSVLDLAWSRTRLEWPWFRRYLVDPAAFRPGTRMPSFWPEGHSAMPDILEGDTARQIAAIWAALQEARVPGAEPAPY